MRYLNEFRRRGHCIDYISFDVSRCNKTGRVLQRLEELGQRVTMSTGWFQVQWNNCINNQLLTINLKFLFKSFPQLRSRSPSSLLTQQSNAVPPGTEESVGRYCAEMSSDGRMLLQHGIVRSNCVDCLDRTNVVQFGIGSNFEIESIYYIILNILLPFSRENRSGLAIVLHGLSLLPLGPSPSHGSMPCVWGNVRWAWGHVGLAICRISTRPFHQNLQKDRRFSSNIFFYFFSFLSLILLIVRSGVGMCYRLSRVITATLSATLKSRTDWTFFWAFSGKSFFFICENGKHIHSLRFDWVIC